MPRHILASGGLLSLVLVGLPAATRGQDCPSANGCSPDAPFAMRLADDLWVCGNSDTTGSWHSLYSMCNECSGWHMPTRGSFFGAYPTPGHVRSLAGEWLTITTAAPRAGYQYVMAGQPAGSYAGGGWLSVQRAEEGQTSSLRLGQISMSRGITDASWRALSSSSEETDNGRGDDGWGDLHKRPTAEFSAPGHFWTSLCQNAQSVHGSYVWNHLWRKTTCTNGLTLPNSRTTCRDGYVLGESCPYTCETGYHVKHEFGPGIHTCSVDTSGTWGEFSGGKCVPDVCTGGFTIEHSSTVCSGVPADICDFSCPHGYAVSGQHMCNLDGIFTGGLCASLPCTWGNNMPNTATTCVGMTSDVCEYTCDYNAAEQQSYVHQGERVCLANGHWSGGGCIPPTGCDDIQWSPLVFDACGVCGGTNATCTDCTGQLFGIAVFDSCGRCDSSQPYSPTVNVITAENSGTISRRRDCHFTDIPSPSISKRLLKEEGGAAE